MDDDDEQKLVRTNHKIFCRIDIYEIIIFFSSFSIIVLYLCVIIVSSHGLIVIDILFTTRIMMFKQIIQYNILLLQLDDLYGIYQNKNKIFVKLSKECKDLTVEKTDLHNAFKSMKMSYEK